MTPEFLWQIAAFVGAVGAVYGGIRKDLERIHEKQAEQGRELERLRDRLEDCQICDGGLIPRRRKSD